MMVAWAFSNAFLHKTNFVIFCIFLLSACSERAVQPEEAHERKKRNLQTARCLEEVQNLFYPLYCFAAATATAKC